MSNHHTSPHKNIPASSKTVVISKRIWAELRAKDDNIIISSIKYVLGGGRGWE
jgi:hypothetical protein